MIPQIDSKLTRIGIFYDGNYFYHVSNYYTYNHPRRARLSIPGLHEFIRNQVATLEGTELRYCQVVDAHYFRGRLTAQEASNRNKLLSDRLFDDVLMREGIVTHYSPISTIRGEKGIDVWLALEAFEQSIFKRFNVLVIIAGDADYIPLIRKLNSLGTRVMVLGWDFQYTDELGNLRVTTTSVDLLDEVAYPVMMHEIIDNKTRRTDPVLNNLFIERPATGITGSTGVAGTYSTSTARTYTREAGTEAEDLGQVKQNRVMTIKDGYGFVATDTPGRNLFFCWQDMEEGEDFNELQPGDVIEYTVAENDRGECANHVRKVHAEV
jgi:uncharacterized LabA/DUF88 family protein/cold shock CspA family protein